MKKSRIVGLIFAAGLILAILPGLIGNIKIRRLKAHIDHVESSSPDRSLELFDDYQGVIHVHTFLGGHSTGTPNELIAAAKKTSLDFVVMTEHSSELFDSSAKTLREQNAGIVFLGGSETVAADGKRFLVIEGFPTLNRADEGASREFFESAKSHGSLIWQPYPLKNKLPEIPVDGVEVFSLHTNAKSMNALLFLSDALWSFARYPELTLARHFQRPDLALRSYDERTANKRTLLFAGVDSHSNLGFSFSDGTNKRWIDIKFDRYETTFALLRNHVLIPKDTRLDKSGLLKALEEGRSYVSIDVLGNAKGFYFGVHTKYKDAPMGSEIALENEAILEVRSPRKARIAILKNGKVIHESSNAEFLDFEVTEKGVYRTEVFRDDLGAPFDEMPWIMSNPVYIR